MVREDLPQKFIDEKFKEFKECWTI